MEAYNKKCDMFKKLILKKFTNNKFEFRLNPISSYVEVLINDKSIITILPDSIWKEINRHINKKIKRQEQKEDFEDCILCCEKIQYNVSCPKCSNNYCSECYINLFKHGKGVITCPHCRYSYGEQMPKYMIDLGIAEIRDKLISVR